MIRHLIRLSDEDIEVIEDQRDTARLERSTKISEIKVNQ